MVISAKTGFEVFPQAHRSAIGETGPTGRNGAVRPTQLEPIRHMPAMPAG